MKPEAHIPHRSRQLLFSTLELLRKEIRPRFADWKDADDWLFSQLDFTKDELAQIYKGRNALYYDASAVDFEAAENEFKKRCPAFAETTGAALLGNSLYFGHTKVFLNEDSALCCKLSDEEEPRYLRYRIEDIKEGDAFFFGSGGAIRTTPDNAHFFKDQPVGKEDQWVVYGDDGEVYFEDDIGVGLGSEVKKFLLSLSEQKAPETQPFSLCEDTDFGVDLMQFISDNREALEFSRRDLDEIRDNNCFGIIMLRAQEYLNAAEVSLDEIDCGPLSMDEHLRGMLIAIDEGFADFAWGEYDPADIKKRVDELFCKDIPSEQPALSFAEQVRSAEARAGSSPALSPAGSPTLHFN